MLAIKQELILKLTKSMFVQEVYPEVQHEAAHQDPQDRAAGRAERRCRRHPQLRPVARQRISLLVSYFFTKTHFLCHPADCEQTCMPCLMMLRLMTYRLSG